MDQISAKQIFEQYYRRTTRKFAQNFLFDANINARIVSAAEDLRGKIVVEVGPGPGGLTLEILKHDVKKLYLIEYDDHWVSVWRELKAQFGEKLEVIGCDALHFNLADLSPNVVISNLPYNISTQLLFRWLPNFDLGEKFVLMFQKEVADRLIAVPSTKAYGKLSILVQWKSRVRKVFDLEPGSFFPAPKVKSSVLQFSPFAPNNGEYRENFECFSQMLTDAFAHRRKTIRGPLGKYFADPLEVLRSLGYNENTRAEQITVADFVKICQMYSDSKRSSTFMPHYRY
ncbi:MAG: 16S rRNA (adenine(1518)-N(6)/adenine(1519)-N(6))-dimethyltransferase RsmA [Holosporaceae bacterium]|jgi:16S rRNA (adenine1518-N6/adenine1519-N6)-dimethyltransferase|nr:16S rRNA (adenine(1518)-N(6)/adenine(1519)-N(6))-dimethyltransferase RsmA [Holosporaceae bacterium]